MTDDAPALRATQPPSTPPAGTPPGGDFSLDVERRAIGDAVQRATSPGSAPASPARCRPCSASSSSASIFSPGQRPVPQPQQHRQPARPGRLHRDHRAGPGLRAAARRDRPVRRAPPAASAPASRRRRSSPAGCTTASPGLLYWSIIGAMVAMIVLGVYLKSISGPVVVAIGVIIALTGQDKHVLLRADPRGRLRLRRRHLRRLAGGRGRHPQLHRHPGALPGLPGRCCCSR